MLFLLGVGVCVISQGGNLLCQGPGTPSGKPGQKAPAPSTCSEHSLQQEDSAHIPPGALALPRVPAEQAGKEGARGQLRRHRMWMPGSSGWEPVDLEPVPIFLTRLLGHLGQL